MFECDAGLSRSHAGIGAFERDMRDYVDPFMRMAMDHDRNFGVALERMN